MRNADVGYRLRVLVTARNAQGAGTATSNISDVVAPAATPNSRPTISLISVVFRGDRVYARFRVCDDGGRNLTVLATDSRPGRVAADAPLLDARRPEPVRRLHPQLAARQAVSRRRPLHADASRP